MFLPARSKRPSSAPAVRRPALFRRVAGHGRLALALVILLAAGMPGPAAGAVVSSNTKLIPADLVPLDTLGHSVAVSADRAIAGSPLHNTVGNNSGAATIFRRMPAGWLPEVSLVPSDLSPFDQFGYAVGIDGTTAIVGAPFHNEVGDDSGVAYVFRQIAGVWMQEGKLVPADLAPGDHFGYSVAIHGNTAVVGAPLRNGPGDNAGAAYVFTRFGGIWAQEARLLPGDLAPLDRFGYAVAVHKDTAIIGAPLHNGAGNDSGAAYVFGRTGPLWMQVASLAPGDLAPFDHFGYSVGISGSAAVIGAPLHNTPGSNAGAAYVFRLTIMGWRQEAGLRPDDLAPLDNFGYAVSILNDLVVAGSPRRNDLGNNSGAAYLFRRAMGRWSQTDKLTASDLSPLDHFGTSVGVGCDGIGVGAPLRNDIGDNSGAAYIFDGLFPACYRAIPVGGVPPAGGTAASPAKGKKKSGKGAKPAKVRLKAKLAPTGIMPGAAGSLDYQSGKGKTQARLALKGVDAGAYTLRVGGVDMGVVQAKRGRAKLRFDSEGRKGALPLAFDPRGRHVEVARGADVILEADFPGE